MKRDSHLDPRMIPSGNECYIAVQNGPFLIDLPIQNGDIPYFCECFTGEHPEKWLNLIGCMVEIQRTDVLIALQTDSHITAGHPPVSSGLFPLGRSI